MVNRRGHDLIILIILFVLWSSPQPIQPDTQRVVITNGTLQTLEVNSDGRSGSIWIEAPNECASIDWTAKTISGITLRSIHSWRADCIRLFVPMMRS